MTLVMTMMMLLALGLLALWAYKSGHVNSRTVGNTQARQEAFAAVQTAIESTISSPQFIEDPHAVAASPILVDVDGNGSADYTARISPAPACYRVRPVLLNELDPAQPNDVPCLVSQRPSGVDSDVPGATQATSMCADSEWNVRAVVEDPVTAARVAANQGIAVRGLVSDAGTGCP